ncbi:MAG: imidazoleglycerol-phosphate dehydratase HisB [Alphaproteobacteria bacterium]|uniref:Imidazoleglycerol-phosphate dehydratase n=1 Tax=Candidatus Nitrobium versatile TaxID=2884831 RepID=A0A953JBM4_9BACT|nr:imidazoleglycerol-phosphate dehydratase HisB [Candidatus Nitrobium versatile]
MKRRATFERVTRETDISVTIDLDGKGEYEVTTSIPFLDHMLNLFCFHGLLDLTVRARGDIEIDYHHLMEDLGITLGEAIRKAVGEKKGIKRYGNATIPMDESLAQVILDLSGRPYLIYKVTPSEGTLRDLEVSLFEDFFRALSNHAMMNLHIIVHYGRDLHHIFEAIFKAFGRSLREAVSLDQRIKGVPTTKGKL